MDVRKIRLILELRESGISNSNVLSALEIIPREKFIPLNYRNQAYENIALPIGDNQTISQPYVVAKMTELLEPEKSSIVMEVGTGSGYQTAVLSHLFKRIYTIERHKKLIDKAENTLNNLKINNIVYYHGDGTKGWPAKFNFKRIIITAVSKKVPKKILSQLSNNGILILPLIYNQNQYITKITKKNEKFSYKKYWKVRFVPLISDKE